jgi:hypothetical protein
MRLNILYGLMLFVILMTGCARARVWQRGNSNILTSRQEIETALFRCEQSPDVQIAHKRANAWNTVSTSTVLIPFVGLALHLTEESVATQYENCLIECMKKAGYLYNKKRANKLNWNKMSDFDISMEQWNKEHPQNQLTSTPITPSSDANKSEHPENQLKSRLITPSSGTTRILTWDFSVAKSGPGNNYPVIATFRKGDKLTIVEQSGEWVKVRSENNQVGWIRSEVLE